MVDPAFAVCDSCQRDVLPGTIGTLLETPPGPCVVCGGKVETHLLGDARVVHCAFPSSAVGAPMRRWVRAPRCTGAVVADSCQPAWRRCET